jgi:nucleotide-binding universal stress UspA family protein
METIIVPTDFSPVAHNALEYALHLTEYFHARIILLNGFHPFLPPNYRAELSYDISSLQKQATLKKLLLLKQEINKEHSEKYDIECITELGFSFEVITQVAKSENADLIVMGITGEAGVLKKQVIGSTAIDVARNQNLPAFIIPENVKYKPIRKISFACDLEKIEETTLLYKAKVFSKIFDAELEIVNVSKHKDLVPAHASNFIEQNLQSIKHRTVLIEGEESVTEQLEKYYRSHETDLIVLSPKKHSLFHNLFNHSVTKEMAFNSRVPLLTIH